MAEPPAGASPPAAPEAPGAQVAAEVAAEQRRWREQVLVALSRAASVILAASLLWSLYTPGAFTPPAALIAAGLLLLSWVRIGYPLRAALLLTSLLTVSLVLLARIGPAPNIFVIFAAVALSATLLLGRRFGLLTVAVTAVAIALSGWLHHLRLLPLNPQWIAYGDPARLLTTGRFVLAYVLVSLVVVLAPGTLLRRAEALALEKARSLDALAREQAARARVQAELAHREAAYGKAVELEALGRLAGAAAHDFGNTLTLMAAAARELGAHPLPPAGAEALADLHLAIDQATAIVRQLRVFGPSPPRLPAPLALAPLLQRAAVALGHVLPRDIEVRLEVEAEPTVVADEGQLLRILTNLALNARDAMRGGGRLTLRLRREAGERPAVVEVADTGEGMTAEVQAHLFDPYFTTKGERGTGLGLASVREVVEAAGGRVEVASAPGQGSTVTLLLPDCAGGEAADQRRRTP